MLRNDRLRPARQDCRFCHVSCLGDCANALQEAKLRQIAEINPILLLYVAFLD
jgi:hypothetical protein